MGDSFVASARLRPEPSEVEQALRYEIEGLRKERDEAQDLASRSTRRLAETAEPGFIGAFARRDAAIAERDQFRARALAAEAERDALRERAERAEGLVGLLQDDLVKLSETHDRCEGCGAPISENEEACTVADVCGCWGYTSDTKGTPCWRYRTRNGIDRAWPECAPLSRALKDQPNVGE